MRTGLWIGLLVITGLSAIYLPFAYNLQPHFSWLVVLVPVLAVALFYVAMMYIRDAKTIHPIWAGFLGLLRCAVYAILTYVFLLPGRQFFETNEIYPKVLLLIDVSGSMRHKDELAQAGRTGKTIGSRVRRRSSSLHELGPGARRERQATRPPGSPGCWKNRRQPFTALARSSTRKTVHKLKEGQNP